MYKKFVASFMTALMAAMTLVSPALGATALKDYPTFLGKVGDFYVVVGKNAAASDVAGAIDIAANLAQLSFKETTVTGVAAVGLTGIERKIAIPSSSAGSQIGGTGANNLPDVLRNFHFSGLKEGQFEYKGTKYSYHERVVLPTSGTNLILTHSLASQVNGTLKMRLEQNGVRYRYVFDTAIPTSTFSFSSANATSYADPLTVNVMGREFRVVAIPSTTSFDALVGSVGWVDQGSTTGLTVGDLTALVDIVYSGNQARIRVVDKDGNTQFTDLVGTGGKSFTYKGDTYNIKVLQGLTITVAGAGTNTAQLLFGKGDVEKTFDGTSGSTISEWGSDWKIGGSFGSSNNVAAGSYIEVAYNPDSIDDPKRYFEPGKKLTGPNGYFELQLAGYSPDKFAQVIIEPSGTVTVFNSTTVTTSMDTMRGLKLSLGTPAVAGTLVYGGTGYDEVYLLFNESDQAAHFNNTEALFAYKDKTSGKVVNLTAPATQSPSGVTTSVIGKVDLSYGGPGASLVNSLTFFFDANKLIANVTLNSTATVAQVALNFTNRTVASTTDVPELMLGASESVADSNDVRALVEGSVSDVSTQVASTPIVTDGGVLLYSVKSNAEANKGVVGIPPETVYGLMQFGKIGEAAPAPAAGVVKEVVAVTTAVAKLDSEVTTADNTGKHLVLVGGPCVNTLVAVLKTAGKFAYGCADWPARNFAVIEAIDGAFATGKQVVVVAGTRAEDTRLASSVLQAYATKLAGVTASKVEVTGTTLATATVTPA